MSLSIEVGPQLPIKEKFEEQEIKEIEKNEMLYKTVCDVLSSAFYQPPKLETHAEHAEEENSADLYYDLKLEVLEKWRLKALHDYLEYDEFSRWKGLMTLQRYDAAIAEMKRKSKMKKESHCSIEGINIEGEKEAIDGDAKIRIHKKHPIQDNIKMGSHPSFKVINIEGEDEAIDEDPKIKIHNKYLKQDPTVWATFFTSEVAMACGLGNPFDKLYKAESTGKVKEQSLINFGKAVPVYAPCITLTAIFFLNFIYTAILTRPLPFRVHANSMLLLLLMYYILALGEALSGCAVAWGSTEVPALLFVCGGAIAPMLLMGSFIMGLKSYFKPVSS